MAWAIRHAAWLHTRFQVHATGKTSFFLVHLTGYTGAIVQFAECVWARDPTDVAGEYKLDSRWHKGIWLGKVETSDEHIAGFRDRVEKVRVVGEVLADVWRGVVPTGAVPAFVGIGGTRRAPKAGYPVTAQTG